MSCSQATAPINLTNTGYSSTCQELCKLTCKYNDSNTTVTNNGTYLSFSYDQSNTPPVTYNSQHYRVADIRIYVPSLHTFDGIHAPAELIVKHTSDTDQLLVCVPIVSSATATKSATLLNKIMSKVSSYARNSGQTANLNISDFNLGSLIPSKPFFTYTGTLPYSPCNGTYNYVVYDITTPATLSAASLRKLKQAIANNTINTVTGAEYFYNPDGPITKSATEDDIYIECAPTGASGETLVDEGPKVSALEKFQLSKVFSSPYFLTVVSALVAFIIFKLAGPAIRRITSFVTRKRAAGRGTAVARSTSVEAV
jgi:carbonic anhydrase